MITHTFCHLYQIGLKREQTIWSHGISTWRAFLDYIVSEKNRHFLSVELLKKEIEHSFKSYQSGDANFFANKLPSHQTWRLFGDYLGSAVYLDIETTGLSAPDITTISLYDGKNIRYYVNGQNLDDFVKDISHYKLIITYNGKSFDVPIIESFFNIKLPQAHIDLRYVLKRLGYSGGLKGCEKRAGIARDNLDGVDGYFAVLLWNDFYYNRNAKALETLLAYNIADVVNLEKLMIMAYNLNVKQLPYISLDSLPEPQNPPLPFHPDIETIHKIRETISAHNTGTKYTYF